MKLSMRVKWILRHPVFLGSLQKVNVRNCLFEDTDEELGHNKLHTAFYIEAGGY
jgi:hypothetical protein